jgi:hypothetical protein
MTLPRSAADVLAKHVLFQLECIDRMYLNVYVPQLQYAPGLVSYSHQHLQMPVASTAALAPLTEAFTKAVRARDHDVPWVDVAKDQRKDEVAQQYLAAVTGTEGVLFIGRAQETTLFRTHKRHRQDGSSYPGITADTGVVNQFSFYCLEEDCGPFFLKFASYFPFNAKLCCNGNEWGAPCGALSYPRHNREEFGGTFLGSMAYLDPKGERDGSMPEKQRPCRRRRGWGVAEPA